MPQGVGYGMGQAPANPDLEVLEALGLGSGARPPMPPMPPPPGGMMAGGGGGMMAGGMMGMPAQMHGGSVPTGMPVAPGQGSVVPGMSDEDVARMIVEAKFGGGPGAPGGPK